MHDAKHEAERYHAQLRIMRATLQRMQGRLELVTPDRIKTDQSADLDNALQSAVNLVDEILAGIDFETGYLKSAVVGEPLDDVLAEADARDADPDWGIREFKPL